ncbi:MAG: antitoxin [Acidimicrobiia bacterium]|jgi:predicted GNAT family N-acyltransferase|nr:antitoxin [Acidimicrobiia bacterium]MBA3955589.1 antitoxin [Acidimicrobiia bacterium]
MRTTIDLPEDLHRVALAIARDQGTSLSQTVVQIMQRGLGTSGTARVSTSERTGLDVVRLGRVVTSEDVRALEDDS